MPTAFVAGFFLTTVLACKPSNSPPGSANNTENHARAEKAPLVGLDELTARLGHLITEIATDDLARMVNPEASLAMEAVRRLALVQGTWRPKTTRYPPGSRDMDTQQQYAKRVLEADQSMVRNRLTLLGQMALALTLRHSGPPRACRWSHGPIRDISDFLGINRWSTFPKQLATKLLAPYDHLAPITVVCDGVTWHMTALHHKTGDRWMLAELDEQAPELVKWRYTPVPQGDIFATRCLTNAMEISSHILKAGRSGDPQALASFVRPRLSAVFRLMTEPAPRTAKSRSALGYLLDNWPQIAGRTKIMIWRDLAALTATTAWPKCAAPRMGAEERHLIKNMATSSPLLKRAATWLTSRIESIRSTQCHCAGQVLTLSLGKVAGKSCWFLLAWNRSEIGPTSRLRHPGSTKSASAGSPTASKTGPTTVHP